MLLGKILKRLFDHRFVITLKEFPIHPPAEGLAFLAVQFPVGLGGAPVGPAAPLHMPYAALILPLLTCAQGNLPPNPGCRAACRAPAQV